MHRGTARAFVAIGLSTFLSTCPLARAQDPELLVDTSGDLSSIGLYVGINNEGIVAFTGTDAEGSKAFIISSPGGTPQTVTVFGSGRMFSGAAINNLPLPWVATRDYWSGFHKVRSWRADGPQIFATIGSSPGDFDSASPFVDINDAGVVAFPALVNESSFTALFAGTGEEDPTLVALYSGTVFVRPQISNNDRIVLRDDLGRIVVWPYPSGSGELIAGPSNGFTSTGMEPGISPDGTIISFAGNRGAGEGVFVSVPYSGGRALLRVAGEGLDGFTDIDADQRVAVSNLGTVANGIRMNVVFVGSQGGASGVFIGELVAIDVAGSMEYRLVGDPVPLITVGDPIGGQAVTDLRIYDPLNRGRLVACRATLATGAAVIRARACDAEPAAYHYKQYRGQWAQWGYLLRVREADWPRLDGRCDYRSITASGCNLTSVVNIMGAYGFETTPGDFQEWLLERWCADPYCPTWAPYCSDAANIRCDDVPCSTNGTGVNYINRSNDFEENVIDEFIRDRFPGSNLTIRHVAPVPLGANMANLIEELKAGRPVKLRVPNSAGCSCDVPIPPSCCTSPCKGPTVGHFVVAYGLKDTTKTDSEIANDLSQILISDPGHTGICDLAQYEANHRNAQWQNWTTDSCPRVYAYRLTARAGMHGVTGTATTSSTGQRGGFGSSPISYIITDPLGRRLGYDPAVGMLNEIPSGSYWVEEPFYALDSDEPAWSPDHPHVRFAIDELVVGTYGVEIIGINDAEFALAVQGRGVTSVTDGLMTDTISADERLLFDFTAGEAGPEPTLTLTSPNGGEAWETGTTYPITWSSTNPTGNIDIELYKGAVFDTSIGSTPMSDGTFDWLIPGDTPDGTDYSVRIWWSNGGPVVADTSDGTFSIIQGALSDYIPAVWRELTPTTRRAHKIAYDSARGKVVLFGGMHSTFGELAGDTWEWDGTSWTQHSTTGPSARYGYAMTYDSARGRVVLFGGYNQVDGVLSGDTWEWDGTSWAQRSTSGPSARYASAMTYDSARGRALLFGGVVVGGSLLGDTWEWDGTTWTQRSTSGPSARVGHAMAFDSGRGRVVLFGGSGGSRLGDTWEWDGTSWAQRFTSGPSARGGPAMAYDSARGKVVLFGGEVGSCPGDTWEWDGTFWTERSVVGPSSCFNSAMTYDSARHRTVLFGGESDAGILGETWEWDGTSWAERSSTGPSERNAHSMVSDSARGKVVLFGGTFGITWVLAGDTWEWDGTSWAQRSTTGPPARAAHAMAFDSARGRVLLFGGNGFDGSEFFERGDTWEWDGTSWVQRSTTGPSARLIHAMAYDSDRGKVVLFGGANAGGYFGDTWEWDGTSWIQRATAGPTPRGTSAMVYDSARRRTVLFGGESSAGTLGDTWEWDGTSWTEQSTTGPTPRRLSSMAYDPIRNRVVLFGGLSNGFNWIRLGDTWEWDGTSWMQRSMSGPSVRRGHAMAWDSTRGGVLLFGAVSSRGDTWIYVNTSCADTSDCDDNDICTSDACVDGICEFTPIPGCCNINADCNDNDPCAACMNHGCVEASIPGCCNSDAECDDNDACTLDTCVNNACTHTPIPACCHSDAECDDNVPCTLDTCVNNACTHANTCCADDSECDDNNPCTIDTCVNGSCVFAPIPGCCNSNADCDDNDPCTIDTCVNGTCVFTPDSDLDGDGVPDCNDACPNDGNKTQPGLCGCGTPDDDSDGDGTLDCDDNCPDDPNKTSPGACGCGVADDDSDGDGIVDCVDNCPSAPNADQADSDSNGVGDVCEPGPVGQPAGTCGCGAGSIIVMPLMWMAFGWMRRRPTARRVDWSAGRFAVSRRSRWSRQIGLGRKGPPADGLWSLRRRSRRRPGWPCSSPDHTAPASDARWFERFARRSLRRFLPGHT